MVVCIRQVVQMVVCTRQVVQMVVRIQQVVQMVVCVRQRSGAIIICVCVESVALATHCTSALLNSNGRIACVVL